MLTKLYQNELTDFGSNKIAKQIPFPHVLSWVLTIPSLYLNHMIDDVIKCKYFLCCWPFFRGNHRSPADSLTKVIDAELWCILWSAPEQTVEIPSHPLWRHCYECCLIANKIPGDTFVFRGNNPATIHKNVLKIIYSSFSKGIRTKWYWYSWNIKWVHSSKYIWIHCFYTRS